jgi:uncharacterized protein (TIGR03086 family)
MTEISERYTRLAGAFAEKVAAVPDDAWSNESPCQEWKARDVLKHVIATQGMFLGFVGRDPAEGPSVDDDPLGAWQAASGAVEAGLADPQVATAEYDGFSGRSTFEEGVGRFLCFDLVVHGWDLARATGQDETIADDDVTLVRQAADAFGPALRSPQAFGPEVEAPPGADDQAKLLAFLGRQP